MLLYTSYFLIIGLFLTMLISLIPNMSIGFEYHIIGLFVGIIGIGELVRGHARKWLHAVPEEWSVSATAAAGSTAGFTIWALTALRWGMQAWFEPIASMALGGLFYVAIGWLIRIEERRRIMCRHDSQF